MTATATHPPAADLRTGDGPWPRRVFVAGLVVAAPLLLWFGRDHWFFLDEWLVLQRDGLTDPGYLDAHNGHWITLVVLDYRLNFRLWGLDTYLPYQVPVVAAHLASAALLRIVMLRVGVRGWLATGAALVFVFLGAGRDNITFGFQISMTGSLLAGLALLLIADHAGPAHRRDLVGLLVGVVGLMTSSVFVALLVGVGVAVLIRRGVRVAAFYAVPLGIVYGAWYLRYGAGEGDPMRLTGNTLRFVARMFGAVFSALTAGGVAGAVLVAVAAVGIVAAVQAGRRTGEWHAAALLLGLLAAWLVFAGLTALGRAESSVTADSHGASRYVHVGVALFLPAVAAGVERLTRWRTVAGVVAGLLLIVGVPRNLDRLADTDPLFGSGIDLFGADSEQIIEAMAHSTAIGEVSRRPRDRHRRAAAADHGGLAGPPRRRRPHPRARRRHARDRAHGDEHPRAGPGGPDRFRPVHADRARGRGHARGRRRDPVRRGGAGDRGRRRRGGAAPPVHQRGPLGRPGARGAGRRGGRGGSHGRLPALTGHGGRSPPPGLHPAAGPAPALSWRARRGMRRWRRRPC